MTPADSDLPDGVRESFQEYQPWRTDRNLRQVYVESFQCIRDFQTFNHRSRIYLQYLNHSNTLFLKPLPKPLRISFVVKSTSPLPSFFNTEREESFDILRGGGAVASICHDMGMCHYFGETSLGCSRIFGKIGFLKENSDFWVLILIFY